MAGERKTPARPLVASPHRAPLEELGLRDPAAVLRLSRYLDTLAAWSPRVNLTAAREPAERVRLLVGAVLPAVGHVRPGRLLDVGSGNGSPGLVLALLRDDVQATLLEPRTKRWAFLLEAARAAAGPRVEVVRTRHDGYAGLPARTVTIRALALPLSELRPLIEPGGLVLVWGVPPAADPAFSGGETIAAGLHAFRRTSVPRET